MDLIKKDTSDLPESKQILKGLSSRHVGERWGVERRLKQMGPQATELLLQLLSEEMRSKQKKRRLFWILLGGGLGAAGALTTALIAGGHPEFLGILGAFGGLGGLSALMVPSPRYYQIIGMLSQQDDIRAVGPLVEALSIPDLNSRMAVARALMHLLPQLQPTDAQWLDVAQRAALHKYIKAADADKESEFLLVILKALDTIEDVSALPSLKALAALFPATDNVRRVQEAAEEYIPHLEAVRDHLQTAQTLLRASEFTTAPEHLLRPVQGVTETPPQQLLRVGYAPEEE